MTSLAPPTDEDTPTAPLANVSRVLLTGFEPFGVPRPPTNPSWELLQPLQGALLKISSTCTIRLCCQELPVVYDLVEQQIPRLHHNANADYAMFIHVGQGKPGAVMLEQQARHGPYTRPDNENDVPRSPYCSDHCQEPATEPQTDQPLDACCLMHGPGLAAYHTGVDVQALAEWLQTERHWLAVETSSDAGLYLCEYVYYHSLYESQQHATQDRVDAAYMRAPGGRPVLFVHVPPVEHPYRLDELTALLCDIVCWLAQQHIDCTSQVH